MPKEVEDVIRKIMDSSKTRAQAIAIAKSRGIIEQRGRHLGVGPAKKSAAGKARRASGARKTSSRRR